MNNTAKEPDAQSTNPPENINLIKQSVWRRPLDLSGLKYMALLALISGFGAFLVHPSPREAAGGDIATYLGMVMGTALIPFAIAAFIALFCKGVAKVVVGSIIMIILYGLMFLGTSVERSARKSNQTALNSISNELRGAKELAQNRLDRVGDIDISAAEVGRSLTNVLSQAALLSIQDSNALNAIIEAMTPLLERRKQTDRIYAKLIDPQSANPSNWKTPENLDARIKLYQEFKDSYEDQLKTLEAIDVALKLELRKRGYTPLKAQQIAEVTFNQETKEISTGMVRCNIRSAEVGLRQMKLLKDNWGTWSVKAGRPEFASQDQNNLWTQTIRDWFQLAEEKEALGRKWTSSK